MPEPNDVDARLARIREATRSLSPPPGLLSRIEQRLEARRVTPAGSLILRQSRPLLLASAALVAAALLLAWRAEARYEAALTSAVVAMEFGS